jgi:hypothetical protein
VIAIAKGVFPVLMAGPALPVAVVIGVTVPAFQFVTVPGPALVFTKALLAGDLEGPS